jgi:hypothetical protein
LPQLGRSQNRGIGATTDEVVKGVAARLLDGKMIADAAFVSVDAGPKAASRAGLADAQFDPQKSGGIGASGCS